MPHAVSENPPDGIHVAGQWQVRETISLPNPALPSEISDLCPVAGTDDVEEAVAAATEAGPAWNQAGAFARGEILRRAAGLVTQRRELLAESMTLTVGKTIRDARAEVMRAAAILHHFAAEAGQPKGEVYESSSKDTFLFTEESPLGVVGAITPWNFPLAIPAWKVAPALAFGNTIIWKPAEIASRSARQLTAILLEAGVPPNALNLVTGPSRNFGDRLIAHPGLDGITFTGSNQVGELIRQRSVASSPRLQLELGGNNPAIVLADADLEFAARTIVAGAMGQSGQRCTATRRIIAVAPIAERIGQLVAAGIGKLEVGDPRSERSDVGPLSSAAAQAEVSDQIDQAIEEGQQLLTGGKRRRPDDGFYVDPTFLFDVDASAAIARDEVFGPVTSLIVADNTDQALGLANDTPFGLSAAVFTENLHDGIELGRQLEAGMVHVNGPTTGAEPHVPFGGWKASGGHFREQGRAARCFFTKDKTTYVSPGGERKGE